ncbi:acyltransferase family protein [Paenibacillus sp. FSL M7-0547]|uniref:acyltransferase family protein n=1 Tax=Paenibacillus sp. FSL M7-0547 TaxID=2954755 RepID=UPI0030F6F4AE
MAKGIGILLVIMGHVPTVPDELKKLIYSFHIPLFFFISGYLYNSMKYNSLSLVEFIKSRAKRYIVPYFIIGFICFFLFGVLYLLLRDGYSTEYLKSIGKYFIGLLYSRGGTSWMAWSSPLWFLTCIFVAELILYYVLKHFKKQYLVFLMAGIAGYFYSVITKIPLPWNIDVALTATCFMYIGNMCRKHNVLERVSKIRYVAILFVVLVLSVLFNSKIDFNLRNFGNILLTYSGGVSGSILILLITNMIKQSNPLEFFGRNSLLMMGFTYSILNVVLLLNLSILDNFILNFIVQAILLSLLVLSIVKVKQINKLRHNRQDPITIK